MEITKETVVDEITIGANNVIYYREATRWVEDGVASAPSFHRSNVTPGQDLTGVPDRVVGICNTVWTPEVVAAYQAVAQAI
jgi:hypothetical protein